MAVGPNAGVVFVGTRKSKVYAVTDRDKDRIADEVKVFAPSVDFTIPTGYASRPTGSCTWWSKIGCFSSLRPSFSTKGRTLQLSRF